MGVLMRLINLNMGKEATTKLEGIINESPSYANERTLIPTRIEDLIQSLRQKFPEMGLSQSG